MLFPEILLLVVLFVVVRLFFKSEQKKWAIFIIALVTIYWFQPLSSIRNLDFWLPTLTLYSALLVWLFIFHDRRLLERNNRSAFFLIIFFPLALLTTNYFLPEILFRISSTPPFRSLSWLFILFIILGFLFLRSRVKYQFKFFFLISLFAGLLILQKNQWLSLEFSRLLRSLNGQSPNLASGTEFVWIGYSYFVFRIIHVLKEHSRIKKLDISLRDFFIYLLFSPAYIAGPIDTVFHFTQELNQTEQADIEDDFLIGGGRIARGLFQKFVLADSLALISLNEFIAAQQVQTFWMWIVVFAYAFRLYFDFAGYTSIAIGISKLIGIQLPENFNRPYLSENITLFWNRWHMTLTQWLRTYFFNPTARFLRLNFHRVPPWIIILFTQTCTMVLIGLWHGIRLNFVIWGIWNAFGLFVHNRWSQYATGTVRSIRLNPSLSKIYQSLSVGLTFVYISLGWVWFALPDVGLSLSVFKTLLGIR